MKYFATSVLLILFLTGFYFGIVLGKKPSSVSSSESETSSGGNTQQTSMQITSKAFNNNKSIPAKYTCDGENIIPPLSFLDIPRGVKSLALIVDDPDIPDSVKDDRGIEVFDHWVVFDISSETTEIEEGKEPQATEGLNSAGKSEYTGPCPPDGEHRYFFRLYALDTLVNLPPQATREDLEEAMAGHIIEKAELVGLYNRK